MSDRVELRTRLLELAIDYETKRFEAERTGREDREQYCERQRRQALVGFHSLGGVE